MFKIQTLNKIANVGLDRFSREKYEIASEFANPDGILVRSQNMLEMDIPASVKAIARAGAGVNNIPVKKCSEKGIVVFNTPGANANSVKELVFAGAFMALRNIPESLQWITTLKDKGDQVPDLVEKGKSQFNGHELKGKTMGVIGLGAIGVMVANDAISLGMKVHGFDPFISIDRAWDLNQRVKKSKSLDILLSECDVISIHVPLTDQTKGLLNADKFKIMKKGVIILNFSRSGLVKNADLKEALESGKVAKYVTDFPEEELLTMKNVICIPHLGASTEEAEDNCAVMAADQMVEFLEHGNIKNSVNFPDCDMPPSGKFRIVIANKNIPNMVGQISTKLASKNINISDLINKHKGDYAYNIIDIDNEIPEDTINEIKSIDGVIMVRTFDNN